MNITEQRQAVHAAICGIAAQCDGAVTKDFVGFDGADTKWGRGIALVPVEKWVDDDYREAARLLARKYHGQAREILGFSVRELEIVAAEAANGDPYWESRQNARNARRRLELSAEIQKRKATLLPNGLAGLSWVKGDPDFQILLERVKTLPGRKFNWNTKINEVPISPALLTFCDEFDIAVPDTIVAVLANAQQVAESKTDIYVSVGSGRIVLDVAYEVGFSVIPADRAYGGSTIKDVFKSYGFVWNDRSDSKVWSLRPGAADAELLAIADSAGLKVSPGVVELCEGREATVPLLSEEDKRRSLLAQASRAKDISELPAEFEQRVLELLGR